MQIKFDFYTEMGLLIMKGRREIWWDWDMNHNQNRRAGRACYILKLPPDVIGEGSLYKRIKQNLIYTKGKGHIITNGVEVLSGGPIFNWHRGSEQGFT